MDFFSWIVLFVGGLCFALMLFLVWLGPRSRDPSRQWVRLSTTYHRRRPVTPSGAPQTRIATDSSCHKYPSTNKDREIGSDGREHGIHKRSQWTQPVHENERYETDDKEAEVKSKHIRHDAVVYR